MLTIKIIYKDETWYKIIAHSILYEPFQKDMQKLQAKIETCNKIRFTQTPIWINKNKQGKYTTSAVINVKTKEEVDYTLQGLDIVATRCKMIKYEQIKPTTQCNKCQKFKYSTISCRAQIQNYRIYTQSIQHMSINTRTAEAIKCVIMCR